MVKLGLYINFHLINTFQAWMFLPIMFSVSNFFFFLSCNYFMRGLSVEGPPWLTVKEFRNGRFQRWGDMCRRTSSIAKEGGLLCIFSTYLSHTTLLSLKTELWQLSWLMTHDTCHFIILILLFKFTTNKIIYTLRN